MAVTRSIENRGANRWKLKTVVKQNRDGKKPRPAHDAVNRSKIPGQNYKSMELANAAWQLLQLDALAAGVGKCMDKCGENESRSLLEEDCSMIPTLDYHADESSSLHKENISMAECSLCSPIPSPLEVPPLCMARGEQDLYGWWRKRSSEKVLGGMMECMQSLAQHCLQAVQAPATTLRVLSLSDGSVNHTNQVPTSVLLAHAFASIGKDALPPGLESVQIFGADNENPKSKFECQIGLQMVPPRLQQGLNCIMCTQTELSWLPPWVELQHVHLDNTKDFKPQLYKSGQGDTEHPSKFDVVLMRQGLCYCRDHSFHCSPPETLELAGIQGDGGSGEPSGTYVLQPGQRLQPGQCCCPPSWRKGKYILHFRSSHSDWVVQDSAASFVWAKLPKRCGNPVLACCPWQVWEGKGYVSKSEEEASCEVAGRPPWRRPPHACKCCAGISLNAPALQSFMLRVAAVLDENQSKAFAFLHGGFYRGTRDEVEEFQVELETAAERFSSANSSIQAIVLRRQEGDEAITPYWARMKGLLLFPRY